MIVDDATLCKIKLVRLLSETIQSAKCRERTAFYDALKGRSDVVLYGAGGVGRKTLAGLRKYGIEPLAFCDSNPELWGTIVDGLRVCSPDTLQKLGGTVATILTIWRGEPDGRYRDIIPSLEAQGIKDVIPVGLLWWKLPNAFLPYYCIDLPHKVIEAKDDIVRAFDLLADEQSRDEFVDQIEWRLTLNHARLADPCTEEVYFPESLIKLTDYEVFVDCGAYDGDTIKQFLENVHDFKKIIAFEPDVRSFKKLNLYEGSLSSFQRARIELFERGVSDFDDVTGFTMDGTVASAIDTEASPSIECVTLDHLLEYCTPTFIKMDIEGSEIDALNGARETIKQCLPTLAICAYHKQADLWNIVNLINEIAPYKYNLYIRRHMCEGWETVVYAIPK